MVGAAELRVFDGGGSQERSGQRAVLDVLLIGISPVFGICLVHGRRSVKKY